MCRISKKETQFNDFKVINFEDFTIAIHEDNNVCVEDKLVLKMIKKKRNLLNLSEFLKQLESDNRFLLKEELKEKFVYKIRANRIIDTINIIDENKNVCKEVLITILNEIECKSVYEIKTKLHYYEDLIEEKNTEIIMLKSDIKRIKLDRKRLAYIIKNGVKSKSDIKLLKKYNFSSFCR